MIFIFCGGINTKLDFIKYTDTNNTLAKNGRKLTS